MGSIYPHFEGVRWDKLGYDSYDFEQCTRFVAVRRGKRLNTNKRKFRILATGKRRCTVFAETITDAKRAACERCGWDISDIYDVHMLHH